MDDEAVKMLDEFLKLANVSFGLSLRPCDWERFHEFVVYVHLKRIDFDGQAVVDRLSAQSKGTEETARQLGRFFDKARELLPRYEAGRAG